MRRFIWPMMRLMRLAEYDPELAEILIDEHKVEMELARLKRDYQVFPAESVRAQIKARMRSLLETRFDLRRQRLEREIRSLQERLEQARQRLQQQDTAKKSLIDAELETLVRELEEQPPLPGGDLDPWDEPDDAPDATSTGPAP
jgi:TolA-binding protein